MVEQTDPNLRVGVEGTAFLTAEARAQRDKRIGGDNIMGISRPRHCIDGAGHVLVFDGRNHFPGEVILDGNQIHFGCGCHVPNLFQPALEKQLNRRTAAMARIH
jgi:hypothetical protein